MPALLTHVDLCAGTGAFSVAGSRVKRFTTVYANDMCKASKVIFDANIASCTLDCRLLKDVLLDNLPKKVDIITGGFPCQPYSKAGRGDGLQDPRSRVFDQIMAVARHCRPRWVACENVANLLTMEKGQVFATLQAIAQQYLPGYKCSWTLYDTAKHTGIPQNRKRLYIVWFRDAADWTRHEFLQPAPALQRVSAFLDRETDVPDEFYYKNRQSRSSYGAMVQRVCTENVRQTQVVYQRRRDGTMIQNKSGVVPTCMAGMGPGSNDLPVVRDNRGVRMLTPRECFRLQGFKDSYVLPDSLSLIQQYRLAGNAVTVAVAQLVLQSLVNLDA